MKVTKLCQWCGRGFTSYVCQRRVACSRSCGAKNRGSWRTFPPESERFWSKVRKTETCWLWTGSSNRGGLGHGRFGRGGTNVLAHRYAWEQTYGPIPDGKNVCHRCDVPRCVNPAHLFLGTQADNMRDCALKGRTIARLTPEQVRSIRARRHAGERCRVLAEEFGVAHSLISRITSGNVWKHA